MAIMKGVQQESVLDLILRSNEGSRSFCCSRRGFLHTSQIAGGGTVGALGMLSWLDVSILWN